MVKPQSGQPLPKPEPRKTVKARKQRADAQQLRAFQDAVWRREGSLLGYDHEPLSEYVADCERCGCSVYHPMSGERKWWIGHVHHIISRRHKATRYDPANGQLLCAACHRKVHERKI